MTQPFASASAIPAPAADDDGAISAIEAYLNSSALAAPQRIGIVSSPTGAVIRDIISVFRRRAHRQSARKNGACTPFLAHKLRE